MTNHTAASLMPRVINRDYFAAAGIHDIENESHRIGFVRHIGSDVYAFLAYVDEGMLRNAHAEHLDAMQLTVDAAWDAAIANLRLILLDKEEGIRQVMLEAPDGSRWAYWTGKDLVSSCIMLPEFFERCQALLQGDAFLVRIASTELVCILTAQQSAALEAFDGYIQIMMKNSNNLVSPAWFTLTAAGLQPFSSGTGSSARSAKPAEAVLDNLYAEDAAHAIPHLENIDLFGLKKGGGADLAIVIALPLAADQRSQRRLRKKIEYYLDYIASDTYLAEAGKPSPLNTRINVYLHEQSAPEILALLKTFEPWVSEQNASLIIASLPKPDPPISALRWGLRWLWQKITGRR